MQETPKMKQRTFATEEQRLEWEKTKIAEYQMEHMNGDMLCSLWIETTGPNPYIHDIVQMCIMVVDNFLIPSQTVLPFYNDIKPKNLDIDFENATISREHIQKASLLGVEPLYAADVLEEWYNKLNLRFNKRIAVLTHNWAEKRAFLMRWLGYENFRGIFSDNARDIMTSAIFENDRANQTCRRYPYPKTLAHYIAIRHCKEFHKRMDIMERVRILPIIYRDMVLCRLKD